MSVGEITTIFFDVGGVLLSNGWDRKERQRAVSRFGLDGDEFEARHGPLVAPLETGAISLDDYLRQTVFDRPRPFSVEEFRGFLLSQSALCPESFAVAEGLARTRRYLMATINNESRELNAYRIAKFGLRSLFSAFFTSCFLGALKPDIAIYRLALDITQRAPQECIMIDDRPENLEAPAKLGMRTIRFESAAQLLRALAAQGVEAGTVA